MKRSVRITSLFLSLSIVIFLAACTKKDESQTSSTTEQTTLTETTVSESTTVPTNTPTSVPTNTPTPSPKPTETPTPVPTDTPTPKPTATPTPKPTKAPKPTQAPTETTAKPTDPPTESSAPTTTKAPEQSDPPGRNLRAEYDATLAYIKALGYTVTVENSEKYKIKFTNATGTYKGSAIIGRGEREWEVDYFPIDRSDPNATYAYYGIGFDPIAQLDEIDPSWMNYAG